ncbi:MAG: hypothetical protein ACKPKO_50700, partial [Candidatus Fonsibacter sp.]
ASFCLGSDLTCEVADAGRWRALPHVGDWAAIGDKCVFLTSGDWACPSFFHSRLDDRKLRRRVLL